MDKISVSSLNRVGQVYEFRIPRQILEKWFNSGSAQRLRDLDHATRVYNEEIRFSRALADQLNQYIVK